MSKNQLIKETVEIARTRCKSAIEEFLEDDEEDCKQDPELLRRMNEGNEWLHKNATPVLIGIAGFRKRHGYTRADKARMKEALGQSAISSTSTKEDIEEEQLRMKNVIQA